jgi:hypothetical protein
MEIKTFRNFVDLLHYLEMKMWEGKENKLSVEVVPLPNRWRLSYEEQTTLPTDPSDEVL